MKLKDEENRRNSINEVKKKWFLLETFLLYFIAEAMVSKVLVTRSETLFEINMCTVHF
jgi:hypothetical protein